MGSGEIIRAVVEYNIPGASQVLSVFHWEQLGSADDTETVDDLTDWVSDSWHPRWEDLAATEASIIGVVFDVMNVDGTVLRALGTEVLNLIGDSGALVLPAANSAMIFAPTDRPKTRGRKYVPGISELTVESGLFTATAIADIAILALPYISTYVGASGTSWLPGVISLAAEAFKFFDQGAGFDEIPDYIRRRRPDRGA